MQFKYLVAGQGVFDTMELAELFRHNMFLSEPETPMPDVEMVLYNPEYKIKWCGEIVWDIIEKRCVHYDSKQRSIERVDPPIDIRLGAVIPKYFRHITSLTNQTYATKEMRTVFKNMRFRAVDDEMVERIK